MVQDFQNQGGPGELSVSGALSVLKDEIHGLDRRVLLSFCAGLTREEIAAHPERMLGAQAVSRYLGLLARRRAGEPVAYLTGSKEFFGLTFAADQSTLIPRPDSECLVEEALRLLEGRNSASVLDMCCGTGCLGISLSSAADWCDVSLTMCDMDAGAIELALRNAAALIPGRVFAGVTGDLFGSLAPAAYDLILCNPPYVSLEGMGELDDGIIGFEPARALYGGPDGLDFYRRLSEEAGPFLAPGGHLVVEIGDGAFSRVSAILSASFRDARAIADLTGRERGVVVTP